MRWAMSCGEDSPPVVVRGDVAAAPEAPSAAAPDKANPSQRSGGGGAAGASAASTVKPSATIAACQCGSLPGA